MTQASTKADVVDFIAELNDAFPSLNLTLADVTPVHRGLVPAIVRTDGTDRTSKATSKFAIMRAVVLTLC